ncbi:Assimilatory nitrate reductase large subunit [Cronobacter condimenti 1330]|uniref:Nitrate reductase n=1 Tax=Cronobacter condimenti 1330 TaxID=1073999 RepID=K8AJ01_9ENTR|nr:nitrate reductase [Cronobacter condimenti]ALB62971.1 nitrate reductase [Cronobacter condimenti 1330]CCJ74227.1 Assimilatory nitrate reductase large subunit [Cronobacter condimenti 1330]
MNSVHTTCPYCGVGCGVVAQREANGAVSVHGDTQHPANFGRLCVKGAALGETTGRQGRLLYPEINGERASWEAALDEAATRLRAIIDTHGPQAVAFYASGQLLTEDYYAANKLMKGFIGAANIDTNSRLCMSSAVVGYKRAFGADAVPCSYEDLEQTDLLIFVGSNAAWAHPVLYQRIAAAKQARPEMKIVVIDPRRTATCDIADLHLALAPGSDAGLFVGLLNALAGELLPGRFDGQDAALAAAREWDVARVAAFCGLAHSDVARFYDWFLSMPTAMTLYTMGINQSSSGSDKCNAIINVHLASGKLGRPGCGPFSLTGQPNAMGGREVGGLANQLACHMGFEPADIARLGRFWGSERIAQTPGLMAVELFEAIGRGEVKAVWIMGTNPAVSLPDSDAVRQSLSRCELVMISEVAAKTDTSHFAHVRFPAQGWGEKNGTVTNSERRISRQRPFLPAPGETRPDWWIVAQMARRLGAGEAFGWQHPQEIFCEHAALSGFENDGTRAFDISGLAGLTREAYDALSPVQWPVTATMPAGTARLLTEKTGWRGGRLAMVAVVPALPQARPDARYPFWLNTGRIRDQWHTMTRTGTVARLMQHQPLPRVSIHPDDAVREGVREGDLVDVVSAQGFMVAWVALSEAQQPGALFVPMHWNAHFATRGRVNALVAPVCCAHSGQPESKQTAVRLQRRHTHWQGELFCRALPALPSELLWWRQAQHGCEHYTLAGVTSPQGWLCDLATHAGWQIQYAEGAGAFHLLAWRDGELMLAFYSGARRPEIQPEAVATAFSEPPACALARHALLAGKRAGNAPAKGRIICSCFGVGENAIRAAITAGCVSTEQLGESLRCGTNCGSCVPELKALLAQAASLSEAANQTGRGERVALEPGEEILPRQARR